MPASVRLDAELDRLVQAAAQRTGQSKSEVIRIGVRAYCEQLLNGQELTAYDLVAHILERDHGARDPAVPTDLAANSEEYLRAGFAAEHAGHHHR
jgi:hypothetical protein